MEHGIGMTNRDIYRGKIKKEKEKISTMRAKMLEEI